MSEIINVSNPTDWRPASLPMATPGAPVPAAEPEADSLELTPFAKAMLDVTGGSSFRAARINAIRGEIEAGIFETPQRLQGTVSRLIDVLG